MFKALLRNPFKNLNKVDYALWIFSAATMVISNLLSSAEALTVISTLIGVTSLILIAKGDVWGQVLMMLFGLLYAITAFRMRYYSEVITYLGMTAPIAGMAVISWLRHPFREDKNEVEIHRLTKKNALVTSLLTVAVTAIFYYIMKALDTPNLAVSTVSIATSFIACALMVCRCSVYALAYALNDCVLIVLWVLASVQDIGYLPMVVCFGVFLLNDVYGFINWYRRGIEQRRQRLQAGYPRG